MKGPGVSYTLRLKTKENDHPDHRQFGGGNCVNEKFFGVCRKLYVALSIKK
jgi:hypothetical protein